METKTHILRCLDCGQVTEASALDGSTLVDCPECSGELYYIGTDIDHEAEAQA